MTASLLLSWREGVTAQADGEGALCVQGPTCRMALRRLGEPGVSALSMLAPPGEEEDRLAELILKAGGAGALAGWYYWLQRLARRGLVCRALHAGGLRVAALVPTSTAFTFAPVTVGVDRPYRLSRFAYLRREGEELVLESPLAHARLVLNDCRLAALVAALAKPATVREHEQDGGLVPSEIVAPLFGLLAGAGLLQEVGPDGAGAEDELPSLRSWEFHDLLFHARSRKGRSDAPFGATYRMAGQFPPPPALKPASAGESCELFSPDLDELQRDDPPLAKVMEGRCSLRDYADRPISVRQLGEFLYRVVRVKDYSEAETETANGPVRMAFTSRPYPAGGGLYELEVYAVVQACDGLVPGLYHYEPRRHRLDRLCERTASFEQLLADAALSTDGPRERLQVLLVVTARFGRLAWKYASIAYALTLKHVGVLYQTMYLAATAMGLAPCAIGGGDSDLSARAAGTDYYTETSVGEFLLGSTDSPGPKGEPGA